MVIKANILSYPLWFYKVLHLGYIIRDKVLIKTNQGSYSKNKQANEQTNKQTNKKYRKIDQQTDNRTSETEITIFESEFPTSVPLYLKPLRGLTSSGC